MVCLRVEALALGLFCRAVNGENHLQKLIHPLIQHRLGQGALLHGLHDIMHAAVSGTRHFQVAAVLYAQGMVIAAAPVRYHDAVKAPLLPQDLLQQVRVLIGIDAVDLVVGGHDGLGLPLLHRNFEAGGIDLPEGALVHHGIVGHTTKLLAVGRKVLRTCRHTLTLHAADIGCRQLARMIGILGEILKIPSAEGTPLNVQSRSQNHVHTEGCRLFAQRRSDLLTQRCVPAVGNGGCRGEAGGRNTSVNAQVIAGACLLPDPVGAV